MDMFSLFFAATIRFCSSQILYMILTLTECTSCSEMWIGGCWSCATDYSDDFVVRGGKDSGADTILDPTGASLARRAMSIANKSAQGGKWILENAYPSRKWRRTPINDTPTTRVDRERRAAYFRVSHMRFHIFMKMRKSGRSQAYPNSSTRGGEIYASASVRGRICFFAVQCRFIRNAASMGYLGGAIVASVLQIRE